MERIGAVLTSPITALFVTLFFGGIAASGKFSQLIAQICILLALGVGGFGIVRSGFKDPRLVIAVVCGVICLICLISYWMKPSPKIVISANSPIRVVQFSLDPLAVGKPVSLKVSFINDSGETVKVISKYSSIWVETLPPETDAEGIHEFEDAAWRHLQNDIPIDIGDSTGAEPAVLSAPPKMYLTVTDVSSLVVSEAMIRKLNDKSAIYFTGIFSIDSTSLQTPFCVRIDKHRDDGLSLCRKNN